MAETDVIRTPDQRLRVFVSSTLQELAAERQAVRDAVERLRLVPVMFELGARPHPPRHVYRSYLAQSQVFVGVYWQSYGWVAPGEQVSGLEDEYLLSAGRPRLIYVKSPAPEREPRLAEMLARIRDDDELSYQRFSAADELQRLVENDLAVLLSERFERTASRSDAAEETPLAGAVPVPATPLVGCDHEAAAVGDLVRGEGVRLVTLTGPGGVGKSRLAAEVAQRMGPGFEDGVRFVELSSVPSAELVGGVIAAALGLNTSAGQLVADLKTYLHARGLLLVLDNFEQVMAAAPLLADLLSAAGGVVALVTSRTVLRLSGEHEFPVPPLPVPGRWADQDTADVQQCASVRLFVERARAAAADFELTSANAGGYGFLATPHQAVTWSGLRAAGSGRHCCGWTTPGSSRSSPSKKRVIAARSRMRVPGIKSRHLRPAGTARCRIPGLVGHGVMLARQPAAQAATSPGSTSGPQASRTHGGRYMSSHSRTSSGPLTSAQMSSSVPFTSTIS
jgi:Domain of unknown function (DUF4062)/AAA domain